MSGPATAVPRRSLLLYAIGFDLVLIAVGVSLLLPTRSGLVVAPFVAAIALATWRGGWKIGVASTLFSLAALLITFEGSLPTAQLTLFTLTGIAASALFDTLPRVAAGEAATPLTPEEWQRAQRQELVRTERTAAIRRQIVSLVMYAALPLLVLVVYLNLSSVLVERLSIPSILQPLILVLAGLTVHYRDALRPLAALFRPVNVALVAYCLVVFISSNWAADVAVADHELSDLLKSFMLLAIAASLAASWRALRGAMLALVAAAVILSVLTLTQVALGNPSVDFGGLAEIEEAHLAGDSSTLRPAGPVGDPNYFARILLLAFPAAAFLGVGRARNIQALFVIAAGLIVMAILVTYSRGGMLSLAAVGCLLVAVGRIRITRVTVAIGFVMLIALIPTPVGQRLLTIEEIFSGKSANVTDSSSYKRKQLLAAGWRMFDDHPVMGVGVGNFGSHYSRYANIVGFEISDYTPLGVRQYAHNLYLEIAVETGLLGLLTFLGAMGVALASLFRSRRTLLGRGQPERAALVTALALAICGYLIASVFLHHSGFHRYLWLVLGFAVAAVRLTEVEGVDTPDPVQSSESRPAASTLLAPSLTGS